MPVSTDPTLRQKLARTVSPLWDARVVLLLFVSGLVSYAQDPAATLGLLSLAPYAVCAWGAALLIVKMLMPYVSMSDLYLRASYGNAAATRIFMARTALLVAVGLSLLFWSK